MPELEPFDARLEAAVHAFADRARTSVDAVAVTRQASLARQRGPLAWLNVSVPVPVPLLLVLGLLLVAFAWSLAGGAPWERRSSVTPIATASPSPASPTATPRPSPDGKGDEVVVGTETISFTTPLSGDRTGEVTRLGGVATVVATADDPRVDGTGTWTIAADRYGTTGPAWGPYRLVASDGTWEGTCEGSLAADGSGGRSCWLAGTESYLGYSYYLLASWPATGTGTVRGVIVPAAPPEP